MLDTVVEETMLPDIAERRSLKTLEIDGLVFTFPEDATDIVINNLLRRAECTQWQCITCTHLFHQHISCTSEHISRIVRPAHGYIIDIGCHIGTVALPLAKVGYSILAIDGSIGSIECLERSNIKNDLYNIRTLNAVLSNTEYMCDFSSEASPYNAIQSGDSVETTTLDKVLSQIETRQNGKGVPCAFIKIDVEGYEKEVLEGSVGTLKTYQPSMCLEINTYCLHNRGQHPSEIFTYLDNLSYELYMVNMQDPTQPYLRQFEPTNRYPFTVENIFALHKSYKKEGVLHMPIGDPWTQEDSDNLLNITLADMPKDSPFYDYMIHLSQTEG